MDLPAPFRAQGEHVAIDLRGGSVVFTTRRGGVSEGRYASLNLGPWTHDHPARVQANRARIATVAGVGADGLLQSHQVHGAAVRVVTEVPVGDGHAPEADGAATALRGVAPIVLAADCLPLAIAGDGAVAMVHGGWRGLAAGVVAAGVAALREVGEDGPLAAAIGPGAGGCCYAVGAEVRAAFSDHDPAVHGPGGTVDLKRIARDELTAAGVGEVHDVGLCTLCAEPGLFFSHRRDGGDTGRQAGLAWLS